MDPYKSGKILQKDFSSSAIRKKYYFWCKLLVVVALMFCTQTDKQLYGREGRKSLSGPEHSFLHLAPTVRGIKCNEHPPTIPAAAESCKPQLSHCVLTRKRMKVRGS